jgi:hypothetical protein
MKYLILGLLMLAGAAFPAAAQEYQDIGVNLPAYPEMAPIPDSPVYYAPQVDSNYFFYDGAFWDYDGERWYQSTWYNGPWQYIDPVFVPTYVLWVPIRYYRRPPAFFRAWHPHYAPRWGEHWGPAWVDRRAGFDRTRRPSPPQRAPLPLYQRQFTAQNYPRGPQQGVLHTQNYRYVSREEVLRQHNAAPAAAAQQERHEGRGARER